MPEPYTTPDAPPDWDQFRDELTCPVCRYNLRGLTAGLCPECGFAFRWAELLAADRDRHPWLFEHGRWRNVRTFVATCLRTPLARRFWRQVTPANPVRVRRLLLYWLLNALPLAAALAYPTVREARRVAEASATFRALTRPLPTPPGAERMYQSPFGPCSQSTLDIYAPRPWSATFWSEAASPPTLAGGSPSLLVSVVAVAVWPWLSFLALSVFRWSMRRAKVGHRHVARVAVYGCDFALLLPLTVGGYYVLMGWPPAEAWVSHLFRSGLFPDDFPLVVWTLLACAAVATYRMTAGYSSYLRFHLPLATVVAGQTVAVVVAAAAIAVVLMRTGR